MSEQPYTILIIDDEEITRTTLAALLEKSNFLVEMAEDGIQGIELARRIHPDVILLDVMMPRMSGYEVCKYIRADAKIAEVPIIMITALDDHDAKLSGLSVGADDFLSKPFDRLELEIRLQTLKRVNRYRHLMEEREKLQEALTELSKKHEQLRQLSRQILEAQENERRHIAVELHDEIGQLVTGLKLILERKPEDMSTVITEARAVTAELFQHLREMSLNLRPTTLDDFGLSAALDGLLKRFTKQTMITVNHNINPLDDQRFDKMIETTVFRVVQEALTNIARHAEVNIANVTMTVAPSHLQVSITDAGKGFDLKSKDQNISIGLSGMAERVNMAGGLFTLQSTPGKGTFILVEFELKTTE
ncbi:MAG: response regulator [Anaerolineales bacterium]|jgi:signal transduction histidine kinase|uniref:ATP-binding response regulator n=1 Tax=Candidatus Villigracilis affinis TaxID=3140682 RepID=UPI001B7837BC|nr:response regulator [Anaerolineales bacterium]MBK9601876.1 response regulator [Anaerolineales bacterium]MBL0345622.1 response regulator [Anaerolineales bacterium]MBP8047941.1 response regulator [Anaerolineales bacterium]